MPGNQNSSIGLDITVQGEKKFKASLGEISAALRVNNAELEQVKEAYEGNENSIDALTAKYDVLDRTLLTQKERVEALEDSLEKTGKRYGETDTRTLRLRESLIKAQTQMSKTEKELEDVSEALKNTDQETEKLSLSLDDIASAAGINLPPALSSLTEKLDGASGACLALVGGLGAVVTGLVSASMSTAQTAKELEVMSQTTGLTVEQLQELSYASAALGIEEDEVQDKMKDLTSAMREARDGSEDAQQAFEKLGVSITERNGELRNAGDVFFDVVDSLGRIENATERDALAMQIFGEEAQRLNPIIEAGSGTINALAQEANNLGYVMDSNTVESFSELDTAFEKFQKQADAVKNSFASALLPVLTALFNAISSIPAPVLQTMVVLVGMVTTVLTVVKAIKEMSSTVSSVKSFFDTFDKSSLKTTAIVLGVVAALIALAAIIAVIIGKSGEIESAMKSVSTSVGNIQSSVTDVQTNYSNVPRYARGTSFHPGGRAVVGEEGPELVDLPAGTRVYNARQTSRLLSGGETNNYYITIDAKSVKEFNDVVRIAQNQKSSIRQGTVRG